MRTAVLLLALLICQSVYSQNIEEIDSYLSNIANNDYGIGSVEIIRNEKLIYKCNFGQNRLALQTKTPVYRVGSITKIMTAVMIYQLINEGKLKANEALYTFFPDAPAAKQITIDQMLGHTSGLKNYNVKNDSLYMWLVEKEASNDEIYAEIVRQGTAFEPGQSTDYSNSAYYLLVRVIEKIHNKPYADVLVERIIKPLKLKYTRSDSDNDAAPSFRLQDNKWVAVNDFRFANITGVGDVISTPHEVNKILQAVFNGKLVTSENLAYMKPVGQTNIFALGKGLMRFPFNEYTFYGHEGHTIGTHSVTMYNETDKTCITLCLNGNNKSMNEIAVNILCLFYGKEYKGEKLSI